jgi:hypothetical protein
MPFNSSSRTVAQLQLRIKRQFGDESGVQITDTDIVSWINDGMVELNRKNNIFKSISTTLSVAAENEYTFPGVNIVKVEQVYYDEAPVEYRSYNDVQELLLRAPDVINLTGLAQVWYEFGGSMFLYPTPAVAGKTIKLLCVIQPTFVANPTDVLPIPDEYYEALYQYVVSQAYESDDDPQNAAAKAGQMQQTLVELETTSRSHNEQFYPMISVDMEDAY